MRWCSKPGYASIVGSGESSYSNVRRRCKAAHGLYLEFQQSLFRLVWSWAYVGSRFAVMNLGPHCVPVRDDAYVPSTGASWSSLKFNAIEPTGHDCTAGTESGSTADVRPECGFMLWNEPIPLSHAHCAHIERSKKCVFDGKQQYVPVQWLCFSYSHRQMG